MATDHLSRSSWAEGFRLEELSPFPARSPFRHAPHREPQTSWMLPSSLLAAEREAFASSQPETLPVNLEGNLFVDGHGASERVPRLGQATES